MTSTAAAFMPLTQSAGESLKLSMQRLWLTGRVLPGGARLWVRHEFQSQESKPVEVVYGFGLPRDATLRRFRISGDGFTVDSELRPTAEAVKVYEEGIRDGSLSTLARQYGDGLVNLTVGNVRPQEKVVVLLELLAGVELHDDSLRLRFPFTLGPSYHPQARAVEVQPGVGEMELPSEEFGDLILPQFAKDAKDLHQVGFCLEVELGEIEEIASPSHTLRVRREDARRSRASLARESDLPDRDLVLDVRTKSGGTTVLAGVDRGGKGRFAGVIPSTRFGKAASGARRLVILLDRSGSMQGVPIAQAKKAIEACLGALDSTDKFGLVAFDNQVEAFRDGLAESTMENRHAAREFLQGIGARGGTELAAGVEAAARLLGQGGDILILTDGQVFNTETILQQARSEGARVHCLGIGSASQDRFLAQLASHTGGVSRFLTPRERVDVPAVELFAAIGRPVAQQVQASVAGLDGSRIAPEPAPYVFAGTPLLVMGDTPSAGDAQLNVKWLGGQAESHLSIPLHLAASPMADTLRLLQGSRIISDLESRCLPADRHGAAGRREASQVTERLAELSREFGLATSGTSLVAVVKRAGDVAGEIPKTQIVPVGMPQDTEFASYFGTLAGAVDPGAIMASMALSSRSLEVPASRRAGRDLLKSAAALFGHAREEIAGAVRDEGAIRSAAPEQRGDSLDDLLVEFAGKLEPDGGMPGATEEVRATNSLAVLLLFLAQGNSRDAGPFRLHVERLLRFLEAQRLQALGTDKAELASLAVGLAAAGRAPKGNWLWHARKLAANREVVRSIFWRDLAKAVGA